MITCVAIDDDPLFLRMIESYFEEFFDAILLSTWENPVRGALAIAKQTPDVVLLDFSMPYMDGFQMLDSLTEQPKVIIISGHLPESQAGYPGDKFLSKSALTSPDVLHDAIKEVLGQSN